MEETTVAMGLEMRLALTLCSRGPRVVKVAVAAITKTGQRGPLLPGP